ncbi:hypothetical protein KZP23_14430 [Echinicola marina]|uniref:hypothetical protein n=1 Tax=Echinicola marina TaxID=2859768 RepID=UPI001CF6254A|nr:hypothetical protein [Echinicola marina]UCS91919.1 hypothetical protein KZP23_14430 [Echinicola marina]
MKNIQYKTFGALLMMVCFLSFSCTDAEDLATPNVASPVLVMVEGSSFPADGEIDVMAKFLELDKSGILDHNVGIDSIPVMDLPITVYVNQTQEVSSLVTDQEGAIMLALTWEELGLTAANTGDQVRLEFTGSYKNVAFRKYHTVRVD